MTFRIVRIMDIQRSGKDRILPVKADLQLLCSNDMVCRGHISRDSERQFLLARQITAMHILQATFSS